MKKCLMALGFLLVSTQVQAQTWEEEYQKLLELEAIEAAVQYNTETIMGEAQAIAENDVDPRCHPVVSYVSNVVAARWLWVNIYADAIAAYCGAADFAWWLDGHFKAWQDSMKQLRIAIDFQRSWVYGGWIRYYM